MKTVLISLFLISLLVILTGCGGPPSSNSKYVVEVTGTDGVEFTGSLNGAGNSNSVEGTVPQTYEVIGWPAAAVMQKKGETGTLTVTISKNDKILNTQSTSAAFGVVTVSSGQE